MTDLTVGAPAPDFELEGPDGPLRLADYAGRSLVLYFYPKDDTTGCTKEAIDFSALIGDFAAAGAVVLGVSKDSAASHKRFKTKHDLKVELGADPSGACVEAYGAWVEKSMYGRTFMGIERSTYLIDPQGKIAGVWRKVKVPGHAAAVLEKARALTM
jgi:peroxiredoxin Q/BCP